MGLLIGQVFLGAKAPPDPLCNHPKLCSFAPAPKNAAHFLYGAVLHRPALLRLVTSVLPTALSKSSRIRLTPNSWMVCRFPAFASGNSCFISSPVQKLKNSAKQNSWRVCRFLLWNSARCFRIQRKLNSGLWLTVFDKKRLFRCQSPPGPPMPCFPYLMPAF